MIGDPAVIVDRFGVDYGESGWPLAGYLYQKLHNDAEYASF
jgi:hypothetical protein